MGRDESCKCRTLIELETAFELVLGDFTQGSIDCCPWIRQRQAPFKIHPAPSPSPHKNSTKPGEPDMNCVTTGGRPTMRMSKVMMLLSGYDLAPPPEAQPIVQKVPPSGDIAIARTGPECADSFSGDQKDSDELEKLLRRALLPSEQVKFRLTFCS